MLFRAVRGLKVLLIAAHIEYFLYVWSLDIHSRHLQWNGSGGLTVCSDMHCVGAKNNELFVC